MKRDLLNKLIFVLFASFAFSVSIQAQLLMEENFEYEPGGLHNQGGWVKYGTHANNPIQVTEQSLTYPGYVDEATGKAIELAISTTGSDEDLCKKFTDTEIKSGTIYVSALMNFKNIEDAASNNTDFFALLAKKGTTFTDGYTGKEHAKIHAKKSSDTKFQLGILRTTGGESAISYTTNEYSFDETYLVVLKYEITGNTAFGSADDIVSLFVNPAIGTTEPEASAIYNGAGVDIDVETTGFYGIELKQYHAGTRNAPNVLIGNIRVATSYAELFKLTPVEEAKIIATPSSLTFYGGYTKETYTKTIKLKGQNLTTDVTIKECPTDVTTETTTITKDALLSENGFDLEITIKPTTEGQYSGNVVLNSEELGDVTIPIAGWFEALEEVAGIKALRDKYEIDKEYGFSYRVTGEAIISYIYKEIKNAGEYDEKIITNYYLQDNERGILLQDGGLGDPMITKEYNVGDKIKEFCGQIQEPSAYIPLYLLSTTDNLGEIISSNNKIEPATVTLDELSATPKPYEYFLIKVTNIEFIDVDANSVFTVGSNLKIKDANGKEATMKIFAGADYIGEKVPLTANLTGISTSSSGNVIAPRSLADIEKLTDPVSIKDNMENALSIIADKGIIRIDGEDVRKTELYDITGNKVAETTAQELHGLAPALYLIKVTTAEGTVIKKLYVK